MKPKPHICTTTTITLLTYSSSQQHRPHPILPFAIHALPIHRQWDKKTQTDEQIGHLFGRYTPGENDSVMVLKVVDVSVTAVAQHIPRTRVVVDTPLQQLPVTMTMMILAKWLQRQTKTTNSNFTQVSKITTSPTVPASACPSVCLRLPTTV